MLSNAGRKKQDFAALYPTVQSHIGFSNTWICFYITNLFKARISHTSQESSLSRECKRMSACERRSRQPLFVSKIPLFPAPYDVVANSTQLIETRQPNPRKNEWLYVVTTRVPHFSLLCDYPDNVNYVYDFSKFKGKCKSTNSGSPLYGIIRTLVNTDIRHQGGTVFPHTSYTKLTPLRILGIYALYILICHLPQTEYISKVPTEYTNRLRWTMHVSKTKASILVRDIWPFDCPRSFINSGLEITAGQRTMSGQK